MNAFNTISVKQSFVLELHVIRNWVVRLFKIPLWKKKKNFIVWVIQTCIVPFFSIFLVHSGKNYPQYFFNLISVRFDLRKLYFRFLTLSDHIFLVPVYSKSNEENLFLRKVHQKIMLHNVISILQIIRSSSIFGSAYGLFRCYVFRANLSCTDFEYLNF